MLYELEVLHHIPLEFLSKTSKNFTDSRKYEDQD